jgi:heme/copper-type cytochrome/quinol oxidase subunit 3
MSLWLFAEAMFFAGLISAYLVGRAGAEAWPPAGQPRLPVLSTAGNTLILLVSGQTVWRAWRAGAGARGLLGVTALLGLAFVLLQGREWVRLVGFGLTTSSSLYGAYFYTLVGAHALHVLAGVVLVLAAWRLAGAAGAAGLRTAAAMYWLFVVGLWPLLYTLVYLL